MFTIDSRNKLTVAIALSFSTIAPGILFFYVFSKEAFYVLDFWKILLLSFSITVPLFSLNYLGIFLRLSQKNRDKYKASNKEKYTKEKKFLIQRAFIPAVFCTSFFYYLIILLGYLFEFKKDSAVFSVLALEILYLFAFVKYKILKKYFYIKLWNFKIT